MGEGFLIIQMMLAAALRSSMDEHESAPYWSVMHHYTVTTSLARSMLHCQMIEGVTRDDNSKVPCGALEPRLTSLCH